MKRQLAIGLIACLLGGTACWPFEEEELAEMTLKRVSGLIHVLRDEERIEVTSETSLEPGDVIVTGRNSTANLRLKGDRRVRLAALTRARVIGESAIEGEAGKLLAETNEPLRVVIGDVEARASEALFRVDRGLGSTRTGIYEGRVNLSAPGEVGLSLSRLREAPVAAGDLPSLPDPYTLRRDDPWDQLYLAGLLDLDDELNLLAAGLAPQVRAGERPGLPFFSALAGGADVSFMRPYLHRASPIDLVFGLTIAKEVPGSLREAFLQAFDLFEDGAQWAVVAGILRVRTRPLIAQINNLIDGAGSGAEDGSGDFELNVAAAESSTGDAPSDTTPDDPGDTGPNNDDNGQAPPPGGTDPGDDDPGDGGDPGGDDEPAEDCDGFADCTVKDLTDPQPDPQPSPSGPPVNGPPVNAPIKP